MEYDIKIRMNSFQLFLKSSPFKAQGPASLRCFTLLWKLIETFISRVEMFVFSYLSYVTVI